MKTFLRIIIILAIMIIVIIASLAGFLGYYGFYGKQIVKESKLGPYTYIYEDFIGPYEKTLPVFDKVYKDIEKEGIKSNIGIGVYFDDPLDVQKDKLRSQCGAIIENNDLIKLPKLEKKFKIGNIKVIDCVIFEFPIKSATSYMLGPIKAYTELANYAQEKGYKLISPSYEIYDEPAKKIIYAFEYTKKD